MHYNYGTIWFYHNLLQAGNSFPVIDVVWNFSRVPWKCEFQTATSMATLSIVDQFFLRRNSIDFITFATQAQPIEVALPSQQPPSQFNISIPRLTNNTNIIVKDESPFTSCSIILDEFSPQRKSNFFTANDANDRQPFNLIFGHNNLFSFKVFSPVIFSSFQNHTFTHFRHYSTHVRPSFPINMGNSSNLLDPNFSLTYSSIQL